MICPCCGHQLERSKEGAEAILNSLRLANHQRRVMQVLLNRFEEPVRSEEIIEALWAHDRNGGPLNVMRSIAVAINTARKRLHGSGLTIAYRKGHHAYRKLCWEAREE